MSCAGCASSLRRRTAPSCRRWRRSSLRSAGVDPPELVYIVPPGPVDTIPNVALIDVLRCSDPQRLAEVFDGRVVFVGSTLAGEDRLKGADHLMPDAAPERHPMPRRLGRSLRAWHRRGPRAEIGHSVPGVFLHAAAADAVLSGWAPKLLGEPLRLLLTGATAAFAAGFALFGGLRWAIPRVVLLTLVIFAGGALMLAARHPAALVRSRPGRARRLRGRLGGAHHAARPAGARHPPRVRQVPVAGVDRAHDRPAQPARARRRIARGDRDVRRSLGFHPVVDRDPGKAADAGAERISRPLRRHHPGLGWLCRQVHRRRRYGDLERARRRAEPRASRPCWPA